jgi:uncharacterized membrane protein YdbT with pleckstrin-like domain
VTEASRTASRPIVTEASTSRKYCCGVPYPKKLLNDYETVALDLHPHWWHFAEPALALAASIVVSIVLLAVDAPTWLKVLLLALIVASAIWMLVRFLQWRTTNFVITSDRVIFRHGVVSKSGIEIPLERVNSVHFSQGLFERMIGAGDLLIESGAEGGQQRFTDVRNPDQVQNLIHSQMELNEDRMFNRGAPAGSDVASQLERLEAMRDRGTLTPEEFDAQKRRLLDT